MRPHRHGQIVTDLQLLDLPMEAHSLIVKSISTDIGHPAESSLHLAHDCLPAPEAHISTSRLQRPTPDLNVVRIWHVIAETSRTFSHVGPGTMRI